MSRATIAGRQAGGYFLASRESSFALISRWTDPPLPQGWHGVWSTPENPGTRVILHDPDDK